MMAQLNTRRPPRIGIIIEGEALKALQAARRDGETSAQTVIRLAAATKGLQKKVA